MLRKYRDAKSAMRDIDQLLPQLLKAVQDFERNPKDPKVKADLDNQVTNSEKVLKVVSFCWVHLLFVGTRGCLEFANYFFHFKRGSLLVILVLTVLEK